MHLVLPAYALLALPVPVDLHSFIPVTYADQEYHYSVCPVTCQNGRNVDLSCVSTRSSHTYQRCADPEILSLRQSMDFDQRSVSAAICSLGSTVSPCLQCYCPYIISTNLNCSTLSYTRHLDYAFHFNGK